METVFQSRAGMRRTLRQVGSIAGTTVIEAIQQPVAFLILFSALLTTLLVPVFQFHRFSEDGRLARESGLSCMLVFGLVLAAGTAGRSVAKEIACGTASAVMGKPVSRVTFVLSKWLGVFLVVAIFWLGVLAATLAAERSSAHFLALESFTGYATDPATLVLGLLGLAAALGTAAVRHYVWRRRFGVTAFLGLTLSQIAVVVVSGFYNRFGSLYPVHGEASCLGGCRGEEHAHALGGWLPYPVELNLRVVAAAVLVLLALAIFAALATALATRLQTGAAFSVCVLVLVLGLAGDAIALGKNVLSWRGLVAGVMPNVQHFWLCDALSQGGSISWSYVAEAGAYALTCCALFLAAGCLAFRERDLG
jgi:ABC-type transport system involved in multi-copper enzyme maturation permease subunit